MTFLAKSFLISKKREVMKKKNFICCFNTKELTAFTLSEVLITLVIIGVLAAIVIPSTMNNTNKHEYRTAAKKAISALNQALALEYSLEGLTAQSFDSAEELVKEVFKKRMNNIASSVSEFTVADCNNDSPDSIFTTTDGMIFCVSNFKSDNSDDPNSKCSYNNKVPCVQNDGANIWIDVNGAKKPNRVTTDSSKPMDIYQAQIYAQRVIPYGEPSQSVFFNKENSSSKKDTNSNGSASQEGANNPNQPDVNEGENNGNGGYNIPDVDDPYDLYDPDKWPSYDDYLKWMWDMMKDNHQ